MKLFTNKETSKKIIIAIILVMTFNFISPTISQASTLDEFGGALFKPISQLLLAVSDLVIEGLQKIFIGSGEIEVVNEENELADDDHRTYSVRYGPAAIFSNKIPSLDVNFINPKYTKDNPYIATETEAYTKNANHTSQLEKTGVTNFDDLMKKIFEILGEELNDSTKAEIEIVITTDYVQDNECQIEIYYKNHCIYIYTDNDDIMEKLSKIISGEDEYNGSKSYTYSEFKRVYDDNKTTINNVIKKSDLTWCELGKLVSEVNLLYEDTTYSSKDDLISSYGLDHADDYYFDGTYEYYTLYKEDSREVYRLNSMRMGLFDSRIGFTLNKYVYSNNSIIEKKVSASYELQKTISTWYKALRAIALVGLLSVLVYVGIRILISSTGQEKAKYKKMIFDWLTAICILFVLQYIMVFIIEITEKITEILSKSAIGENGEDVLMSSLRTSIGPATTFSVIFAQLLMYLVLVIYTVMFTIQYLKRLVYMAFFTLISPLIALTYPLDKIKDGQAQAFTTWLREYIFNALMQPMHLLLYTIFVSSALEFSMSNPIYAIVAIGFMLPAEKFFRKMFGFDKAESSNPLGAAAGGALVMNAINKMGHKSGKKAAGGSGGSDGSGGSAPRYVSAPKGSGNGPTKGKSATAFGQKVAGAKQAGSKNLLNGAKTLGGHYFNKANGKKLLKGAGRWARKGIVGAAGAATLGTVGLAAGIATGDASNAFSYGLAGAGAGYMGANSLGDKITDFEKHNREIFKEGALGTDEYNTRNSIKDLNNDNDFNRVCKDLGVTKKEDKEALIRQFHSNGVTGTEDIKKAMIAGASYKSNNPNDSVTQNQIISAAKIRKQATKNGMKRKDIESDLIAKGITGKDLDKAMSLIDML